MTRHFLMLMDAMRQAARRIGVLSRQQLSLKVVGGRVLPLPQFVEAMPSPDARMCAVIVGIYSDRREHPELRFVLVVDQTAVKPMAEAVMGSRMAADPAMSRSMIQEFGNVGASAIANHLSGRIGESIHISAPDVVEDSWASLAAATIASFLDPADDIPVLTTEMRLGSKRFSGSVFLLADRNADLEENLVHAVAKG